MEELAQTLAGKQRRYDEAARSRAAAIAHEEQKNTAEEIGLVKPRTPEEKQQRLDYINSQEFADDEYRTGYHTNFPALIYDRDIFQGIAYGIEPEKKGYLFDFYKKEIQKVTGDIKNFERLMMERFELTREAYLVKTLPPAEQELAMELAERATELLRVMNTMTYKPRQTELFADEREVLRFAKPLLPKKEE